MMPTDLTGALNIKQPLMRTTLYFFQKYMGTRKKSLSVDIFFANFQSNCSFKYLIVIFLSTLSKLKTTLRFSRHFCFVFILVLCIYFFSDATGVVLVSLELTLKTLNISHNLFSCFCC